MASRVSSLSASAAGLSQRMRWMRGNAWRRPICGGSSAGRRRRRPRAPAPGVDLAHRAERLDGVVADAAVELQQLLVGEAGIGLAHRHQLVGPCRRGARRRKCSPNSRTSACRGRAGHTSARVDGEGGALPFEPRALGPARRHRGCPSASASGPRCRRRGRRHASAGARRSSRRQ